MFKSEKKKNGYIIKIIDRTIVITLNNKIVIAQSFSDALKAQIAFNNL